MLLPVLPNTHDPDREAIARGLQQALGATGGQLRFSQHDRLLYSTDASLYQVEPIGVVIPASTDDAARVLAWCVRNNVAILPRGGATSLAGQCTNHAVVIDMSSNCRALKSIDAAARQCEVEPGINVDELNDALTRRNTNLFFAPDPATTRQATIGGCIGNNAAGARSNRYRRTVENLAAVEVVLPTDPPERLWLRPGAGRDNPTARRLARGVIDIVRRHARQIRERFPTTIRRNAGYALDMILNQLDAGATEETLDLTPLIAGSEGTLALIVGAKLKLHPTPRAKSLTVISFDSLENAIAAVQPILTTNPTAVELLDDVVLDAARGNNETRAYVDLLPRRDGGDPRAVLYVEYFGFGDGEGGQAAAETELRSSSARLRDVLASCAPHALIQHTSAAAMMKAWALRRAGEPLLHGLGGADGRKPVTFVEDNAVPVERLAEFVREFKKLVARHGTRAAYWAHASVGVLHIRPMINLHDPADRRRMVEIAVEVADLARACGGVMSGEHGDGRVRGPLLERFFGPELMAAFREVKALFDPRGLMNPGNITNPGPIESIASGLRVDHEHVGNHTHDHAHAIDSHAAPHNPLDSHTFFDFSDQHGLLGAAEQCNGAGVCRKRSGGTMCPSYMATMDERHSTRGRGNALRLAISGQFSEAARNGSEHPPLPSPGTPNFHDEGTIATLDLCLSCKGCKSECPSNVDIARLKAEYTAQRYRELGKVPLKARIFGHVRVLNALGSMFAPFSNWANGLGITKSLLQRVLGVDARRTVPRFERSLYRVLKGRKASRQAGIEASRRAKVVLFADCFTTYNEPRIGLAAVTVLEALGYEVQLRPIAGESASGFKGCCGRALISTGLLADAIETADHTLGLLAPAIDDDSVAAVVVCEPSCLSAIKDDWLQLKLRTPIDRRRKLAAKSMMIEEFIESRWMDHPNRAAVEKPIARAQGETLARYGLPGSTGSDGAANVLLHAHCHQKALWGAESSAALLRRLIGDRLRTLDSGCCGMAGSFGYTADHYDLSMKIAELTLIPAIKAAPAATVCAPGTSCRHQIHDGAGREVMHPIELMAHMLA